MHLYNVALAILAYVAASYAILAVVCYVITHNKRIAYVLRNRSSLGMPPRQRDYLDLRGAPLPRRPYVIVAGKRY